VTDLLINLLASLVAGTAVWLAQRLLRLRRAARTRAFFAVKPGDQCLLSVSRHFSSPSERSVHRQDVAALVELGSIVRTCGGEPELLPFDDDSPGLGRLTEFCVGGPTTSPRTAAHVRSMLPGVVYHTDVQQISVGGSTFRREPRVEEYCLVARVWGPSGGRPVFIIGGQVAPSNLAAARFLSRSHRELYRRYGAAKPFCLMLKVVESGTYGPDFTEIAADVSAEAFQPVPTVEEPTPAP